MSVLQVPRKLQRLTHVAGTAGRLAHTGSVGTLERRTSDRCYRIAARRPPVAAAGTVVEPGYQLECTRSAVIADHPFAAASCRVGHTVPVDLAAPGLDPSAQLPGARVPLLACASYPLPSSWPSILCESL